MPSPLPPVGSQWRGNSHPGEAPRLPTDFYPASRREHSFRRLYPYKAWERASTSYHTSSSGGKMPPARQGCRNRACVPVMAVGEPIPGRRAGRKPSGGRGSTTVTAGAGRLSGRRERQGEEWAPCLRSARLSSRGSCGRKRARSSRWRRRRTPRARARRCAALSRATWCAGRAAASGIWMATSISTSATPWGRSPSAIASPPSTTPCGGSLRMGSSSAIPRRWKWRWPATWWRSSPAPRACAS